MASTKELSIEIMEIIVIKQLRIQFLFYLKCLINSEFKTEYVDLFCLVR